MAETDFNDVPVPVPPAAADDGKKDEEDGGRFEAFLARFAG
jgi:hypothetical protein